MKKYFEFKNKYKPQPRIKIIAEIVVNIDILLLKNFSCKLKNSTSKIGYYSYTNTLALIKMNILQYYRKFIITFSSLVSIFFIFILISGNLKISFEGIQNVTILVIGLSILLGTIYFIYDTYFGPVERIKELKKYPFTEFQKIGFKNEKDYLIGKINGYTVIIGYSWRNNKGLPCVFGMVLFEPKFNGKILSNYFIEKWQKSIKDEYNFWEYGSLKTEWSFLKGKPNHTLIIEKLKKNSNLISNKGIKKISVENWKNEIENHTKTNANTVYN